MCRGPKKSELKSEHIPNSECNNCQYETDRATLKSFFLIKDISQSYKFMGNVCVCFMYNYLIRNENSMA